MPQYYSFSRVSLLLTPYVRYRCGEGTDRQEFQPDLSVHLPWQQDTRITGDVPFLEVDFDLPRFTGWKQVGGSCTLCMVKSSCMCCRN